MGKDNGLLGPGPAVEARDPAGPILLAAPLAGWCNWQHTSLWIWELGFESLPGSENHRRALRRAPMAVLSLIRDNRGLVP